MEGGRLGGTGFPQPAASAAEREYSIDTKQSRCVGPGLSNVTPNIPPGLNYFKRREAF